MSNLETPSPNRRISPEVVIPMKLRDFAGSTEEQVEGGRSTRSRRVWGMRWPGVALGEVGDHDVSTVRGEGVWCTVMKIGAEGWAMTRVYA
jgi:hypothetical protein